MKPIFAAIAAAAVLSVASAPAQAQTFRELMEDIGLQKRKQESIDFSERAPLVVPPSLDALPPPEDKAAIASANPHWPTDPDEIRAAEEAERQKIPQHQRRKYQENAAKEIYKIRAREREEGLTAATPAEYDTSFDRNTVLSPGELKEVRDRRAKEAAEAGPVVMAEPERKRLTDPPPGYRTPSPAQPYGPGEAEKKKSGWLSKINPFN